MTAVEQSRIIEEVLDEVLGLGPLEPLLKEPSISDILVNRFDKVYIERGGKLAEVAGAIPRRRASAAHYRKSGLAGRAPHR